MPLSLQFVKPYNLDLSTGILTDPDGNLVPNSNDSTPATIGMDTNLFKDQVGELAKKKTPIEKVFKGIDLHPEVTNKVEAKRIAEEHYKSFQENPFLGLVKAGKELISEVPKNLETLGKLNEKSLAWQDEQLQKLGIPTKKEMQKGMTPEQIATSEMLINSTLGTLSAPKAVTSAAPKVFQGLKGLSTKLLEKFKGMPKEITPQQFNEVVNRTMKEGVRKADLDLVKEMAERQKTKLVPIDSVKPTQFGEDLY